jgi:hypothetical protein
MADTVKLTCWTCEREFATAFGPGRPPRHCSDDCRALARKVRRRIRYVEQAEFRRMSHIPPF